MKFILYNLETRKIIKWTKEEILYYLNKDTEDDREKYDLSDFGEGLREYTQLRFQGVEE